MSAINFQATKPTVSVYARFARGLSEQAGTELDARWERSVGARLV